MHSNHDFFWLRILTLFTFLQPAYNCEAQFGVATDTTKYTPSNLVIFSPKHITAKSFVIPVALITTGALGISGEFFISNPEIKEERDEHFKNFKTSIDNYLQFAPVAAGYAMLINNPQHRFLVYTKKVVLTEIMMNALVFPAKHLIKEKRPDTGAPTSFPSGHTAQAFAGATIFCDEFAQHNLLLSASVYSGAAAIGVLRVLNNRHYACDVIAGAGFGVLSAKLSEWIIEPHGKKSKATFDHCL